MRRLILAALAGLLVSSAVAARFKFADDSYFKIVATDSTSGSFGEGITYYNNHVYKCFNDAAPSKLLANWDVTSRTSPVLKSTYSSKPNGAIDIAVLSTDGIKTYAYVCYYTNESSNTFRIFDVTDDTQWVDVGGSSITSLPLFATEIVVSTDASYVIVGFDQAASTNSVRKINVVNKSSPIVTSDIVDWTDGARVNGLALYGSTLCVTFEIGVPNSFRLANAVTMSTMNNVSSNVASEPRENTFSADGRYVFTGSWFETTGVMSIDVQTSSAPLTVATLPTPDSVISIYRQGNFLFVGVADTAINTTNDTLKILDIRNPYNLHYLTPTWNRPTNVTGITGDGSRYIFVGGRSVTYGLVVIDGQGLN